MKNKFESEEEVIRLIDKYREDIKSDLTHIEQYNELADSLRLTCWAHKIAGLRDEIETYHRQIEWRTGRLATLGEILAEMRTMELPFKDTSNEHNETGDQVGSV